MARSGGPSSLWHRACPERSRGAGSVPQNPGLSTPAIDSWKGKISVALRSELVTFFKCSIRSVILSGAPRECFFLMADGRGVEGPRECLDLQGCRREFSRECLDVALWSQAPWGSFDSA